MSVVTWNWGPGASRALQSTAPYIDLEGGIRAQKTTALCAWMLMGATQYPGSYGLLGRYTDDLTHSILKPHWREYCAKCGVQPLWNSSEGYDELPGGSRIYIRGLRASDTAGKFSKIRGLTLARIGIDQPEEMPAEFHPELVGRLSQPGFPHQLLYTPQPVNPGHWIADVFPEHNPNPDYLYVRTNCYDNRVNLGDAYIARLEQEYPLGTSQRRTLLEGRRGLASSGTPVYKGYFNPALHVSDLVKIDPYAPLIECWDFGHGHPCVLWCQFLPVGRLQILGAVMGTSMFLEDFAPAALVYRRLWCQNPSVLYCAGDPSGLDSNNQGVRTTKVRDILSEHGVYPESLPHANTIEAQFNVTQSVSRYMRRMALDGQPAFLVHPRAILIDKHGPTPSDFVTAALEAGLVWSDRMVAGMRAGIRQIKNDGLYDHPMRALAYGVIAFEPNQPSQDDLVKAKSREIRRAQRDRDEDDQPRHRRRFQSAASRGGY